MYHNNYCFIFSVMCCVFKMCFRLSSWSHVSIVLFFQSCVVSFKCVLDFQVVLCIIIFVVVVVVAVFVFRLSVPRRVFMT